MNPKTKIIRIGNKKGYSLISMQYIVLKILNFKRQRSRCHQVTLVLFLCNYYAKNRVSFPQMKTEQYPVLATALSLPDISMVINLSIFLEC